MDHTIYPKDAKLLIIQAQDLGMAHSIDEASFEALEKGWVTSAGILTPAPWFPEVVRWAQAHPDLDYGLQLDLNAEWTAFRWRPVSAQTATSGVVDPAGYLPLDAGYILQHAKPDQVETEYEAQIALTHKARIPIDYLDSHGDFVLAMPWLFHAYWDTASKADLPAVIARQFVLQRGIRTKTEEVYNVGGEKIDLKDVPIDRIITMVPGIAQKDWLSAYERALSHLPPGVYMLTVHLGNDNEELRAMTQGHPNWGAQWRQNDLDVVSSPEFHKFLKDEGFTLVRWKDLRKVTARGK